MTFLPGDRSGTKFLDGKTFLNITIMNFTTRFAGLMLAGCSLFATTGKTLAAPINYGDFNGLNLSYLQVTETVNTPGDTAPLYGAPTLIGDQLDFNPKGFSAGAVNGNLDITDGQLNFTLLSNLGRAITDLAVSEGGDFTLLGTGTAATNVGFAISLATVKVLAVDGINLGAPVSLTPVTASSTRNLITHPGIGQLWDLTNNYDVNAALINAGVPFSLGATKIEVAINDTLTAISETGTIAFIAKKDFVLISATVIPEPSSTALLAVTAIAGAVTRRRRR
jgi:hypothetical protein